MLILICIVILAALFWQLAPRQKVKLKSYDQNGLENIELGSIQDYLEREEAKFSDIRENQQKQVLWAGEVETKTKYALVYIHGFSASRGELMPVPDEIAKALGANLYYTRLAGHGRTGAAMGKVDVNEWLRDLDEALRIGRAIGEEVILMSASTGSTLSTLAIHGSLSEDIAAMVMVSPNFLPRDPQAPLTVLPFFKYWAPIFAGKTLSWETKNELQEHYWQSEYPLGAPTPMMTLVRFVESYKTQSPVMPILMYYSKEDQVVNADITDEFAANWGADVIHPELSEADDPAHHLIMGDAFSPSQNAFAISTITIWLKERL